MSNFRVGQKVVCVDDCFPSTHLALPVRGAVYTVREIVPDWFPGRTALRLEEIINPETPWSDLTMSEVAFNARRFRPLVEKKTDTGMSILTQILRDVENNMPVKERV